MAQGNATIVVKVKAASALFRASVDGKRLLFKNGEARLGLPGGPAEHALMWFIRDRPGTGYEIAVSEPAAVKMSHKAKLDASGMDAGIYRFKL